VARDFLIVEACDFQGYPGGGQMQQAIMLMKAFAEKAALVGVTTDDFPVGKWGEREIGGRCFRYFSIGRRERRFSRPLFPDRMVNLAQLLPYRKAILSLGIGKALLQAPEMLLACGHWGWESLCYWFPGVNNPLAHPRYRWGRAFQGLFPRIFFRVLRKADVILAAADDVSLRRLKETHSRLLHGREILKFPTRFDANIFHPIDRTEARRRIPFARPGPAVVMVGRISKEKGWDLLLDAFALFLRRRPDACMFFVGDGEDRELLENRISGYGLAGCVSVTGMMPQKDVATYVGAADLVVVGSLAEGWSTSMVEALACGCTIVSTNVSGARDMIVPGVNGFVVGDRSPETFAEAMTLAVRLPEAGHVSLALSQQWSVRNLKRDLTRVWTAIAGEDGPAGSPVVRNARTTSLNLDLR
jgi:glycosyltransferase involved in cell wall biosynthesis